jgi:hypothetical protein
VQGKKQDYIPTQFAQATYFINFAILKSHTQNALTLTAKNHFGSLSNDGGSQRTPNAAGYYDMHSTRAMETPGMGHYRCLVDLMGHPKLGGKTLLYLIDGLYAGRGWDSHPIRWKMTPFDGDWPASLFLSQDPVAIDSVAYDFLRTNGRTIPRVFVMATRATSADSRRCPARRTTSTRQLWPTIRLRGPSTIPTMTAA